MNDAYMVLTFEMNTYFAQILSSLLLKNEWYYVLCNVDCGVGNVWCHSLQPHNFID